jgi:hypothetical protein
MNTATKKTDELTLPFPKSIKELPFQRDFPEKHFEKIKLGFNPQVMEEKWFVYFKNYTLNFHPSWTGM